MIYAIMYQATKSTPCGLCDGTASNGLLLRAAEEAKFEVFVTGDHGLTCQQNMKGRTIGVVTLLRQRLDELLAFLAEIAQAVDRPSPDRFKLWESQNEPG